VGHYTLYGKKNPSLSPFLLDALRVHELILLGWNSVVVEAGMFASHLIWLYQTGSLGALTKRFRRRCYELARCGKEKAEAN